MKTVFIVQYHSNSYYAGRDEILGVYATEEEAEKRAKEFINSEAFISERCPGECWWEEYTIGEKCLSTGVKRMSEDLICRYCVTCKYYELDWGDPPCLYCDEGYSEWEPYEDEGGKSNESN